MTCASHVQAVGQGFPGQLGIFGDEHIEGLSRIASAVRNEGGVAIAQLHHAGMRAPKDLIDTSPMSPSDQPKHGARALTLEEVDGVIEDFVRAAERAERAGFDGVELHGAHGYLLCQFLSPQLNQRSDAFGGSLQNRARIFFMILEAIRRRCRPDFTVGVRLSPERFGMKLLEVREAAQGLIDSATSTSWISRCGTSKRSLKRPSSKAARCSAGRSTLIASKCASALPARSTIPPTPRVSSTPAPTS